MGTLYSITQSVYEYFYPNTTPSLTPEKIKLHCMRLTHGLARRMQTTKNEIVKLEEQFITKINQPKRDKFVQKVLIDQLITLSLQFGVYEQLHAYSHRIHQQAHQLSSGLDTISNDCLTAIFAIVHLYKELSLEQFIDLKDFLPQPYPVIGIDKLEDRIKRYLQYKQPTEYQRNLYVVEMSRRNPTKISVLKLNQANHGFLQQPTKNDQHDFNSNGLYARSASYEVKQEDLNQDLNHQIEQFSA